MMKNGAIIISPFCDNNCIFCGKIKRVSQEELQKIEQSVSKNIDYHISNNVDRIEISGCDPGEYEDLHKLIKYIKSRGISKVELATNGVHISNNKIALKLIESGLDAIKIPIYGHNAEIHQQVTRGEGSFDKAVKAIKIFKSAGVKINIRSSILEANKSCMINLYQFLLKLVDHKDDISFHVICVTGNDFSWYVNAKDLSQYLRPLDQWGLKHEKSINFIEFPMCVFGYISNRFQQGGAPSQGVQQPDLKIEGELNTPKYREKKYHEMCKECVARNRCNGFLKNDLEGFGVGDLKPITELKLYN